MPNIFCNITEDNSSSIGCLRNSMSAIQERVVLFIEYSCYLYYMLGCAYLVEYGILVDLTIIVYTISLWPKEIWEYRIS